MHMKMRLKNVDEICHKIFLSQSLKIVNEAINPYHHIAAISTPS